jgi:hypothetical protein
LTSFQSDPKWWAGVQDAYIISHLTAWPWRWRWPWPWGGGWVNGLNGSMHPVTKALARLARLYSTAQWVGALSRLLRLLEHSGGPDISTPFSPIPCLALALALPDSVLGMHANQFLLNSRNAHTALGHDRLAKPVRHEVSRKQHL